jgi:hypothetical protein
MLVQAASSVEAAASEKPRRPKLGEAAGKAVGKAEGPAQGEAEGKPDVDDGFN